MATRSRLLGVLVACVICLLHPRVFGAPIGGSSGASTEKSSHPNIVLIVIDAWRADRLDATRNDQSVMPALLEWASHSVRFTNATTACTWTRPAMASLFTSLHVGAHQVDFGNVVLPATIETLAAFFKSAGYHTIAVQTNGHVTHATGLDQGFDVFDDYSAAVPPAETLTDYGIARMQEAEAPFLLYVHYMDMHVPYWPPQTYQTLFGYPDPALSQDEQTIAEHFADGPDSYLFDQVDYTLGLKPTRRYAELSATGKEAVWTLYDGECRYADTEVMKLINAVVQEHPDTVFVVTADHGEHLFEHAQLGHGLTLYNPVFRVPLILNAPGVTPATVSSVVSSVDILPTLAILAGLPARPTWQGRDLLASRDPDGPIFSYTRGGAVPRTVDLDGVRLGSMKLIHNVKAEEYELYNVEEDPGELNNLASLYPSVVAELQALLDAHHEDNIRSRVRTATITASPSGLIEEGMRLALTAPAGSVYQWKKDGADITDDPPRVTGATARTLTLNPVVPEDAGIYECRFDDGAKSLQYTQPHLLNVLPPNSVPATSPPALFVLVAILIGLRIARRRRTTDDG